MEPAFYAEEPEDDHGFRGRGLRESDIPRISEICEGVYQGADYVPLRIKGWLQDPNSRPCGLEYKGKLISVMNLRFIDGQTTLWTEGGRVHKDFRGRGWTKRMNWFVFPTYVFPMKTIVRIRSAVYSFNKVSLNMMRNSYEVLRERQFRTEQVELALQVLQKYHSRGNPLVKLTPQEFFLAATNLTNEEREELFPKGVLNDDIKFYQLMPDNLRYFAKHVFYGEFVDGKLRSFSFGVADIVVTGSVWNGSIYATTKDSFFTHLLHHFQVAVDSKISVAQIFHSLRFIKAVEEADLAQFIDRKFPNNDIILLEADISGLISAHL